MDAQIENRSKMIRIAMFYSPEMHRKMSFEEFLKNTKKGNLPKEELIVFLDQKNEEIIKSQSFWRDYDRYTESFERDVELIVFTTLKTMQMRLDGKKLIVQSQEIVDKIGRMFILPMGTFKGLRGYDDGTNPAIIVKHRQNDYTDIGDINVKSNTETTISRITNLSEQTQENMLANFVELGIGRTNWITEDKSKKSKWTSRTYKDITEKYNRQLSKEGLLRLPKYSMESTGIENRMKKSQIYLGETDIITTLKAVYEAPLDQLFEIYNKTQSEKYQITTHDINEILEKQGENTQVKYFYQLVDQLDKYKKTDIYRYSQVIAMFLETIASIVELDDLDQRIEKYKGHPGYSLYTFLNLKVQDIYQVIGNLELGEYFAGLYKNEFEKMGGFTKNQKVIEYVNHIQDFCLKDPAGARDFTIDEDIYHLLIEPFSAIGVAIKEEQFLKQFKTLNK